MSTMGPVPAYGRATAADVRAWLLRAILFAALLGGSIGGTVALARYLWVITPPPSYELHVSPGELPRPGDPPLFVRGRKLFIVNLAEGEGISYPFGPNGLSYQDGPQPAKRSGYLVLWDKSPEKGCAIAWLPRWDFEGIKGWFRDPCHGATFTRAGYNVFGPTPRPMDTFPARIERDGTLVIDTRHAVPGGPDNAQRIATLTRNPATGR